MRHTIANIVATAACICTFILAPIAVAEASQTPPSQNITSKLAAYMTASADTDDFCGSVIVTQGEVTLYEAGFGLANREHNVPNTPETKFRLGSITKQFTAMAILILQEQGKLSINDPISKHITDAPTTWKDVTIHHLLTHTSGIHSYTDIPDMMEKTVRTPVGVDDVIATFRDLPLDFTPGEKFEYSNSGYILLGKIIEVASGSDYEAFVRDHIFEPLGMHNSGYDHMETVLPHRAVGYHKEGNTVINAPYIDMAWPYAAGSLYSTVRDLVIWHRALQAGKLISQDSYKTMYTPAHTGYACGWNVDDRAGRVAYSHGGGIHGFQTMILRYPTEDLCVAVLCNTIPSKAGRVANDLARITLGQDVKLPGEDKVVVRIGPETFDPLVGRYQLPVPGDTPVVVSFRREGEHYYTQLTGQDEFEIFPTSADEFFLKVVEARLKFTRNDDGRGTSVTLFQNGREITATRMEESGTPAGASSVQEPGPSHAAP